MAKNLERLIGRSAWLIPDSQIAKANSAAFGCLFLLPFSVSKPQPKHGDERTCQSERQARNHLACAKSDESAENKQADACGPTRQDAQPIIENRAFLPLVTYLLLFFGDYENTLGRTGKNLLIAAKRLWWRKRALMHARNFARDLYRNETGQQFDSGFIGKLRELLFEIFNFRRGAEFLCRWACWLATIAGKT